jgi:hypothetical protein
MVGTNSLDSVTNPKKFVDEEIFVTGSGNNLILRDVYSISSCSSIEKLIKRNSRSQHQSRCKWDVQIIDHSSAIVGSVGAVEAGHLIGKIKCEDKPQR